MLIWQDSHFLANKVHNTTTITLDPIQSTTLIIQFFLQINLNHYHVS
jgi:hypothetical protein